MAHSEQSLKAYVQKILSIQKEQANRPLSETEMKQIAADLGMSDEDWNNVKVSFQGHITRGQGYLQYQNWDDALQEFKQANTLFPNNLEVLDGLSQAYYERWKLGKEKNDQNQAGYFARKYLQFVPSHQASLKLISELKKGEALPNPMGRKIAVLSAIVGSLVLILLIVIIYLNQNRQQPVSPSPYQQEASTSTSNTPQENTAGGQNLVKVTKSGTTMGENQVPVELILAEGESPFEIELESSELSPYSDSYSYRMKAFVIPTGTEIDELDLILELKTASGKIVAKDTDDAVSEHFPTVRNGERHPVEILIHEKEKAPAITKAVLKVKKIDHAPAPSSYEASPEVELTWQPRRPANTNLIVRERSSQYSVNEYINKGQVGHKLVLEFENTGERRIESLTVLVEWIGQDDKPILSEEQLITYSSEPKIMPGHTRVEYVLQDVPVAKVEMIKAYRLKVVEVE